MECKKCGRTCDDGAIFCGGCGARLDGKVPCKSCGNLNAADNAYCVFCGARIDGKTVCSNCGTAYDGEFCPACGKAKGSAKSGGNAPKAASEGKVGLFRKICGIIGGAAMMAGVLFALIFVFLIGVESSAGALITGDVERDLYYFFGDSYDAVDGVTGENVWFVDLLKTQFNAYSIIGTVCVAAILLCVVAFAIVASIKYALSWAKKKKNTANPWAMASILSFLTGTVFFYAYTYVALEAASVGLNTALSGATKAGVVLCIIFAALGFLGNILSEGKSLWRKSNLAKTVCSLIGIVLAGVIVGLSRGFFSVLEGQESSVSVLYKQNYLSFNTLIIQEVMNISSEAAYYGQATSALEIASVFNLLTQLLAVVVPVLAGLSVCANAKGVTGAKRSGLTYAILLTCFSVLLLVFSLIAWSNFKELFSLTEMEGEIESSFGYPIGCVIVSALLLAATIVRAAIAKRSGNQKSYEVDFV